MVGMNDIRQAYRHQLYIYIYINHFVPFEICVPIVHYSSRILRWSLKTSLMKFGLNKYKQVEFIGIFFYYMQF
jgi:hypothetical protein